VLLPVASQEVVIQAHARLEVLDKRRGESGSVSDVRFERGARSAPSIYHEPPLLVHHLPQPSTSNLPTPLRDFCTPPTTFFAIPTMRANCLPHARVSVLINGTVLPEYCTESSDGKGALSFIEAVPGTTFTVELELEAAFVNYNPQDLLTFCISLDGELVCSNLVYPNVRPTKSTLDGVLEQRQGQTTLRGFVFAENKTSMLSSIGMSSMC